MVRPLTHLWRPRPGLQVLRRMRTTSKQKGNAKAKNEECRKVDGKAGDKKNRHRLPLTKAADLYFKEVFELPLYAHDFEKESIDILRRLRNNFVRHQSKIAKMDAELQARVAAPKFQRERGALRDSGRTWHPSMGCIREQAGALKSWARMLEDRRFMRFPFKETEL